MKTSGLLSVLLLISCFSCNTKQTDGSNLDKFVIKKGVNVSHWLSQTNIRGTERENYMQAADFAKIAEMGFDHVRLPIDEMHLWDEDGNRQEDAFQLMHQAIKWSFENNLRVIVDLHVIRSHHFNSKDNTLWTDPLEQEKFWGFWKVLSKELSIYPNAKLAYELMNEAVADNSEDWNKLISKGIELVRENETERTIIVGSNKWQQVYTFPELHVPKGDTNIILSFHFYEPFIVTHYKTPWNIIGKYNGPVNYPGYSIDTNLYVTLDKELLPQVIEQNNNYSKELLEEHIMIAKNIADMYNLPLYCGEFGAYPSTPIETRALLYKDLTEIFSKHNIAWAHWNYKNDFPIVNNKSLEPIEELVSVLIKD